MQAEEVKVLFRADIEGLAGGRSVCYEAHEVVRSTTCGWWIAHPVTGKERWTNGKWASTTKEEALERLKSRTKSYLRHSFIAYLDAARKAEVLGFPTGDFSVEEIIHFLGMDADQIAKNVKDKIAANLIEMEDAETEGESDIPF